MDTPNQQEPKKNRSLAIVGIVVSVCALVFLYGYNLSRAWGGCNLGLSGCYFVPEIHWLFQFITYGFIAFFIQQSIAGQSQKFSIFFKTFLILLCVWVGLAFIFSGPIGANIIENTEIGCNLLFGEQPHNQCYTGLAKSENNINLCKKLTDYGQASGDCFKYFALKSNDVSLCDKRDGYCIQDVARQTKNADTCKLITQNYTREQCYALIAEATNNPLLCQYSSSAFTFCNESDRSGRIEQNPEAYITAQEVNLNVELLNNNLKSGQKDVELIKIIAQTPSGIAALKSFEIVIDGGSIFATFPKFLMYKEQNGSLQQITGGASFSRSDTRPSIANVANSAVTVSSETPQIFEIKVDVNKNLSESLKLISVNAVALGKTKVNVKIVGNRNIIIGN